MLPLIVLFALGAAAAAAGYHRRPSTSPATVPAWRSRQPRSTLPEWRAETSQGNEWALGRHASEADARAAASARETATERVIRVYRSTDPEPSAVLHPRLERPWCELRPQDLEAEDLADRAGLERWARCSTRTDTEIEIMAARFDRAFADAATDGEALALAQTRDAMRRAFQARGEATR